MFDDVFTHLLPVLWNDGDDGVKIYITINQHTEYLEVEHCDASTLLIKYIQWAHNYCAVEIW